MNLSKTSPLPVSHSQVSSPSFSPSSLKQSDDSMINFDEYLDPFIQLFTKASYTTYVASSVFAYYSQKAFSAIYVVFCRLIFDPIFDPTSSSFKKLIDQLEKNVPLLEQKIISLEQKFWQLHCITDDMVYLCNLDDEISATSDQLNMYAKMLQGRAHPFPIQPKLFQVKNDFANLRYKFSCYCFENEQKIFEQFNKSVSFFNKPEVEIPKDIQQQLVETWKNFERVFANRHNSNGIYYQIQHGMFQLTNKSEACSNTSFSSVEPLKLRNIGNSCYLDSVLQSILCIPHIRKTLSLPVDPPLNIIDEHKIREEVIKKISDEGEINDPIEIEKAIEKAIKKANWEYQDEVKAYPKKVAIQKEISKFITNQQQLKEGQQLSRMELILFLLEGAGPSVARLRDAIFLSGFNYDLYYDSHNIKKQQDAADVIALLIDSLLPDCKLYWRGHQSAPDVLPGLEFVLKDQVEGKGEPVSVLSIPLSSQEKYQTLAGLMIPFLGKHYQNDGGRKLNPKDATVIKEKEEEALKSLEAEEVEVQKFVEWYRLTQLPPVLTIQFKRFLTKGSNKAKNFEKNKCDYPVALPDDGILDLSKYYDPLVGEPKHALYRVKSMVRHSGGVDGGHYTADVEINGKYFHCNDIGSNPFDLISRDKFFGRKDPYLLFLERISDDEAEPILVERAAKAAAAKAPAGKKKSS